MKKCDVLITATKCLVVLGFAVALSWMAVSNGDYTDIFKVIAFGVFGYFFGEQSGKKQADN